MSIAVTINTQVRRALLDLQRASWIPVVFRNRILRHLGASIHPTAKVSHSVTIKYPALLTLGPWSHINIGCVLDGDGAADFAEIREALAARRAERDTLKRGHDELGAAPVIVLNPTVVETYRNRVRTLATHLNVESSTGQEVLARLRDLISEVRCVPLNDGAWSVELVTSLGGVVALATTPRQALQLAGSDHSVKLVAEEGLEPPTPGL